MNKLSSRMLWGAVLIVSGFLFLMESLGLLIIGSIWPVFFGIAGIIFLYTFVRDTNQWWSVIPGFTLLGLATVIYLNAAAPEVAGHLTGSVFLGSIGLSFIAILLTTKGQQWWAIIPGGVLLTLTGVTALTPYVKGEMTGAMFMLGLAVTFAIVYFIPTHGRRMRWALYPSIILGIIGILLLVTTIQLAKFVWPVVIIAIGLYIITRALHFD